MRTNGLVGLLLISLFGVSTLALTGCFPKGGAAPGPLSSQTLEVAKTRFPDATPEALEDGRKVFLASCAKCHSYPDVLAVPEERWPKSAARMGKKANLPDADTDKMLHFVLALRASQGNPK